MDAEVQEVTVVPSDPEIQEVPVASEVVVVDDDPIKTPLPRNDPLEHLEKAIENSCETLASFATNIMHFSYESQDLLYNKVNEFVKDLREIDAKSKEVDASIPIEVLEAIDKGRNPEHCTYQMLESCAEANNISRGKLQAMRSFRDAFEQALAEPATKSVDKEQTHAAKQTDGAMSIPNTELRSIPAGNGVTNGF